MGYRLGADTTVDEPLCLFWTILLPRLVFGSGTMDMLERELEIAPGGAGVF
jgi:hypothetical protein